jgi:hypothetical protein
MDETPGFVLVERALRGRRFGVLATLTATGAPHATEVVYAVSGRDERLLLYVVTRTTTRKVGNIRTHPHVAFVVPVPRLLVPAFPPRAVQFQGTADVVAAGDVDALRAFSSTWFLRRILTEERRIVSHGGDMCFIRIQPARTLFTYGLGMSVLDTIRRPREANGRVVLPVDR